MTVTVESATETPAGIAVAAYPVLKGGLAGHDEVRAELSLVEALGFSGELGDVVVVPGADGTVSFLVGLGEAETLDAEACRRAGAALALAASHLKSVALDCSSLVGDRLDADTMATALGEGAMLATYRYAAKKQQPTERPALERMVLVGDGLEPGVVRARVRAEAVMLTRDVINSPAAEMTPTLFADLATAQGRAKGFTVQVHDERAAKEMGLGGLLGVGQGSANPPRLVRAEYVPKGGSDTTVALVGKGITFDSGGLSIKTLTGMMTMKYDVAGAAAVLGVLSACAALEIGVRVVGFMPLAENMPSGTATRPGDVLTIRNGKTIEVLNTDAEGRLVLADALSLAAEERPDAIVDIATLTGPVIVALGRRIAAVMGNDDRLAAAVEAASRRAGEPMWRMPLPLGYRSMLDSEVADMKNIGVIGEGGTLMAGLILEEFVDGISWAHLDIAGAGWSDDNRGYIRKGGLGFGVRTILELLERYQPLGGAPAEPPIGRKLLR